jgi:hypothetical protein
MGDLAGLGRLRIILLQRPGRVEQVERGGVQHVRDAPALVPLVGAPFGSVGVSKPQQALKV